MGIRQRAAVREREPAPEVARVLLLEDDVTARLTLQAILEASGYAVDSAASAPEALDKLERAQYALVLCGMREEDRDECRRVINHARAQDYKPATAYLPAPPPPAATPAPSRPAPSWARGPPPPC